MPNRLKINVPPKFSVRIGKKLATNAANNQWVNEPQAIPDALTELGKISDINTHITDP